MLTVKEGLHVFNVCLHGHLLSLHSHHVLHEHENMVQRNHLLGLFIIHEDCQLFLLPIG